MANPPGGIIEVIEVMKVIAVPAPRVVNAPKQFLSFLVFPLGSKPSSTYTVVMEFVTLLLLGAVAFIGVALYSNHLKSRRRERAQRIRERIA